MPTLSRNVQRIVIRQGLQADIPALISAEMGWDTDKKVLRVGDNSTSPVKIMTNKSTDSFDFTSVPLIKFGKVEFASGATVGGIDLSTINSSAGIIVRSAVSGVFSRTQVVSGDGSISVIGGDGLSGNIDVRVDPSLISAIAAAQTATVTAAATAPITSKLGDIWYNTGNGITYLRITDGVTSTWKDIITDPNAATGANLSYGSTAPTSPSLGDMWFNTGDEILYVRTNDGTSDLWLDVSSTGSGGGGGSGVTATAGTSAPSSPVAGDLWFNTTYDTLFVYIPTGGGASAWVDISTSGSSSGGSSGSVDPWACVPIGALVTVDLGEGAGIVPSNTSSDYRYVELTAGLTGAGGYNNGVLTSESVSGSDPNIVATAVVSLAGSPFNGKTLHLINTERRFVRPGTAGTLEESANLAHTHTGTTDNSGGTGTFTILTNNGTGGSGGWAYIKDQSYWTPTQQAAGTGYNHTHALTINSDGGTEARPRSIGAKYYRRIK